MVLRIDPASRTFFVSHEKIVGLMDAMTMPFEVRDAKEIESLAPGAIVEFTLVVDDRLRTRRESASAATKAQSKTRLRLGVSLS